MRTPFLHCNIIIYQEAFFLKPADLNPKFSGVPYPTDWICETYPISLLFLYKELLIDSIFLKILSIDGIWISPPVRLQTAPYCNLNQTNPAFTNHHYHQCILTHKSVSWEVVHPLVGPQTSKAAQPVAEFFNYSPFVLLGPIST